MAVAPVVGISACLLGCPVRYDGTAFDALSAIGEERAAFVFVPVCPECMAGLGVPRPRITLTGDGSDVLDGRGRALAEDGADVTETLLAGVTACADALARAGARAAILKERSPSCASEQARIVDSDGSERRGSGVFAALLRRRGISLLTEDDLAEPARWARARQALAACRDGVEKR